MRRPGSSKTGAKWFSEESLAILAEIRTVSNSAARYRAGDNRGRKPQRGTNGTKTLAANGDAERADVAARVKAPQGNCVLTGSQ